MHQLRKGKILALILGFYLKIRYLIHFMCYSIHSFEDVLFHAIILLKVLMLLDFIAVSEDMFPKHWCNPSQSSIPLKCRWYREINWVGGGKSGLRRVESAYLGKVLLLYPLWAYGWCWIFGMILKDFMKYLFYVVVFYLGYFDVEILL